MSRRKDVGAPTTAQLEAELERERYGRRYRSALRGTVCALAIVAMVAMLAAAGLPVLQMSGGVMAPTLETGEIVVVIRTEAIEPGDIAAFYSNNKLLVRRVIAGAGDWVDIDAAGNVTVNGAPLSEPYLTEKALGECGIELPCQVPEGRLFVMGDRRGTAVDSRSPAVGYVSGEQILGRVGVRVWPLKRIAWFG